MLERKSNLKSGAQNCSKTSSSKLLCVFTYLKFTFNIGEIIRLIDLKSLASFTILCPKMFRMFRELQPAALKLLPAREATCCLEGYGLMRAAGERGKMFLD